MSLADGTHWMRLLTIETVVTALAVAVWVRHFQVAALVCEAVHPMRTMSQGRAR